MTERRDPAVEAARRALNTDQLRSDPIDAFALAAAREALAPIRELHKEADGYCRECCHADPWLWEQPYQPWPCDTARLIYTSEELSDE